MSPLGSWGRLQQAWLRGRVGPTSEGSQRACYPGTASAQRELGLRYKLIPKKGVERQAYETQLVVGSESEIRGLYPTNHLLSF